MSAVRHVSSVVASIIAAAALAFVVPRVTSDPAGMPRLMVTGDSISQGSAGDFTWRYRLYEHLIEAGDVVDMVGPRNTLFDNVAGQQGDTRYADPAFDADHDSWWGRAAWQEQSTIAAEVDTAAPDYVLLLLGVNDLGWTSAEPAAVAQSLRCIIDNACGARDGLTVVVGKVLPTGRAAVDPEFAARVAALNGLIGGLPSMSRPGCAVAVAETADGFDATTDTYDGTHPNANGELKIAAAFQSVLAAGFGLGTEFARPLPALPTGPRIPPALTATAGNGTAALAWSESPGVTGYWVWRRDRTTGSGWQRAAVPLKMSASPWLDAPLVNGHTYEYRLETSKGRDTGVSSDVVAVTPRAPPAPVRLSASAAVAIDYRTSTTVATRLTDARTGTPVPDAAVQLQRKGATGWALTRRAITSGTGRASVRVTPTVTTTYRWFYAGNAVRRATASTPRTVSVRQVVSVHLTRTTVRRGAAVRLFGAVGPAPRGQPVVLQRWGRTRWRTVATTDLQRRRMPDGATRVGYVFTVRPASVGIARYRVISPATATRLLGRSRVVAVRVR